MFINPKLRIVNYSKENIDFFCAICKFPLTLNEDFEKNQNFGCCYECYQTYVESRINEWKDGWRPDKIEVKEYIYIRKKINSEIIILTELEKSNGT
jgi:hypothetical protein